MPDVSARYGAPMGRTPARPADCAEPLAVTLCRVDINPGGYDNGGAYWGTGAPLYWVESVCGTLSEYFRAADRTAARAHVLASYPGARFPAPGAETRATRREELESFIRGYFECAEWLWPESDGESGFDRDKVRGWSRRARRTMRDDCRAFYNANRADLEVYAAESGRDIESAGHDFFLSREGHGAGFFDRGNHEVFRTLQRAARGWGGYGHPYLNRGWVEI